MIAEGGVLYMERDGRVYEVTEHPVNRAAVREVYGPAAMWHRSRAALEGHKLLRAGAVVKAHGGIRADRSAVILSVRVLAVKDMGIRVEVEGPNGKYDRYIPDGEIIRVLEEAPSNA